MFSRKKKEICTKEPENKATHKMYIESIIVILDTLSENGRLIK